MADTWRAVQAARFNARAGLDRPRRPAPYRRPTDAEIAAITDPVSKLVVTLGRAGWDAMAPIREAAAARAAALAEHQRRAHG